MYAGRLKVSELAFKTLWLQKKVEQKKNKTKVELRE